MAHSVSHKNVCQLNLLPTPQILNMSGLLFLLCCMLTVTWGEETTMVSTPRAEESMSPDLPPTDESSPGSPAESPPGSTPGSFQWTEQTTLPTHPSTHMPKSSAAPDDRSPSNLINMKHCLPVLMVSGGLIIACAILLISTLILAWKVCHLSGRLKALASNDDLISSSDFWTGTSKRAKGKAEDKEDSVLLCELDQKQGETVDVKEESVVANGDKKMEEEEKEKEKEAGEAKQAVAAEQSSSTKPQEDAPSSPPAEAEAAPTSD